MRKTEVEQHYSPEQFAALLHVDVSTVWRLVKKHKLSYRKLGRRTARFSASEVNRFLESRDISAP